MSAYGAVTISTEPVALFELSIVQISVARIQDLFCEPVAHAVCGKVRVAKASGELGGSLPPSRGGVWVVSVTSVRLWLEVFQESSVQVRDKKRVTAARRPVDASVPIVIGGL